MNFSNIYLEGLDKDFVSRSKQSTSFSLRYLSQLERRVRENRMNYSGL